MAETKSQSSDLQEHSQILASCYRLILEIARKKRLELKETTVRDKFSDQTQTAEESAAVDKPSAKGV